MRIVVDVTPLSLPRTGIGNYLLAMLRGLTEVATSHELVAFTAVGPRGKGRIEAAIDGLPLSRRLLLVPPSSHVWRTAWSALGRPAVERLAGRLDVFHYSDWMYPSQRGGIRATTIYDLVPVHFPDWVHPRTERMHRRKYRHAARSADVVVVDSTFTAADVERTLGVPRERITVAWPAVDPMFTPEGSPAEFSAPYVLTVATLEARKNLETLVEAVRILHGRGSELRLAVAGAEGWQAPLLKEPWITALGFVADEVLPRLYRGASVFVYPSKYEGFGIPIIEAMASGTPVVASSHPSLDDASGEAALRADPDSPEAFADAIERALDTDPGRGLGHARRFTARAMGVQVLGAYEAAR